MERSRMSPEIRRTDEELSNLQDLIRLSYNRLNGLRTQCSTSAEITQQEIRTLEVKLVRLFSKQLLVKRRVSVQKLPQSSRLIPSLHLWLEVVGLSPTIVQGLCVQIKSLEGLKDRAENDIRTIMRDLHALDEETRCLTRALKNLNRQTDFEVETERKWKKGVEVDPEILCDLFWDSWDLYKLPGYPTTAKAASVGGYPRIDRGMGDPRRGLTPPNTPPVRGRTLLHTLSPMRTSGSLDPETFPLTKSKSHESQLTNRIESASETNLVTLDQGGVRVGGWDGSPGHRREDSGSSLYAPRSPRTLYRSMGHVISHRFSKMFKVSTCDYCSKQVIIGLRCKECKFKCHRDCEPKVPPSCGLPSGLVGYFVKTLQEGEILPPPRLKNENPPSPTRTPKGLKASPRVVHPPMVPSPRSRKTTKGPQNPLAPPFSGPDSSSSSCNSSAPSSPALFTSLVSTTNSGQAFIFGNKRSPADKRKSPPPQTDTVDLASTEMSNDSDRTVSQTSGSGSTDSEKTLAPRLDSQDSQVSDGEPSDRWPRQNSLSSREWDIPFDELVLGDVIGVGHFGTVYRGNWHGDVAIKVLDMAYLNGDKTLEQFKAEVTIFRKTRHENIVLFMGACMKPPRLAIVTSLCKGNSLYTHLHLRKDKFNMNKTLLIAQQISQGMGYLHARGIIHKDLKSKNVFLESGKVIITDFGLFSVNKLIYAAGMAGESLNIPPGWLCYLAPEVMRNLRPESSRPDSDLPFTKASDIYAFGTVWYELLLGEWPFKGLPNETVIWQVGNGIRQPLPALFTKDIKEILMVCWASDPEKRDEFPGILRLLEKVPKKRLARSPSHPIHLSRSAESVF